jgi:ketosteroid isomerase-like protein
LPSLANRGERPVWFTGALAPVVVERKYAMTIPTAREVVDRLIAVVADGPSEQMADLFAADAVFEAPYVLPGLPTREVGREIFRNHLRDGAGLQKFTGIDNLRIFETADPEVVIAEYLVHGRVLATGKTFSHQLVLFARVRAGLIVESRNYANPLDAAVAFDIFDTMLSTPASV